MGKKNQDEFTTISIKRKDAEKLEKMKVHPNQAIWEVIENLLERK